MQRRDPAKPKSDGSVGARLFITMAFIVDRLVAATDAASSWLRDLRFRGFLRLAHHPRGDDIFIVSYPKAGTTVMQMMVHSILRDGGMDFPHIDAVVPWFETRVHRNPSSLDEIPSPRAFKTHLTLSQLPRNASYIYLLRNPKDSCVSQYFHYSSLGGFNGGLPAFVAKFLSGEVSKESWFEHLSACCRHRGRGRVLLVSYDDIVHDRGNVIDRVSKFCGRSLSPEKRALVIEQRGFAFMKQYTKKFDPRYTAGTPRINETDFIRKGETGDWVNQLSPALASAIDRRLDETVVNLQSVFTAAHRRILQPPSTRLRGTLLAKIDARSPNNRLLIASHQDIIPWGIQTLASGEPLHVGDCVRLNVRWDDGVGIGVESAEVVSTTPPTVQLRLKEIGEVDAARLKTYCAAADRAVFSMLPDVAV
jgi:hypothetical protein